MKRDGSVRDGRCTIADAFGSIRLRASYYTADAIYGILNFAAGEKASNPIQREDYSGLAKEVVMTDLEFQDWLQTEVQSGRMTLQQHDDLLEQKQHFDAERMEIEQQFPNRVVGYVNGIRKVSSSVQDLLAQAQQSCPNRMVYFKPIGFDLY